MAGRDYILTLFALLEPEVRTHHRDVPVFLKSAG